jgi:hypothetical protein
MDALAKAFGVSVLLLAGYTILLISPFRRFTAEHLRSDRFALHLFGISLICYFLGVFVSLVITYKFSHGLAADYLVKVAKYTNLPTSSICALLVAPVLGTIDRLQIMVRMLGDPAVKERSWWRLDWKSGAAAVARFVLICNDAAIRTLYRATFYRKPLMITLKSGKVYVGTPIRNVWEPSLQPTFIKIVPMLSGYRDRDTHKVSMSTNYRDITSRMIPRPNAKPARIDDPLARDIADLKMNGGESVPIDMQDMGIVILWSEMVTMSLYDECVYRAFQETEPVKKDSSVFFGKRGLLAKLVSWGAS